MTHRHWFKIALSWLLAISATAALPARAQDYPTRPVKIITDSGPGSAVDVILRVIADRLTQVWGQQVLAVNQPGGGGAIATRIAAGAARGGRQSPDRGAARLRACRLPRRRADVHLGRPLAGRDDAGAIDRAGQT